MPPKPPRRHKTSAEFTVEDHLRQQQSRGDWQPPETEEYKAYVAEVHRAAGLDDEPEGEESAERSVAEHLRDLQSEWF